MSKNGFCADKELDFVQYNVIEGRTHSMSGFKRFSLASCALLLSLSNVAYADTETPTETPSVEYEKGIN